MRGLGQQKSVTFLQHGTLVILTLETHNTGPQHPETKVHIGNRSSTWTRAETMRNRRAEANQCTSCDAHICVICMMIYVCAGVVKCANEVACAANTCKEAARAIPAKLNVQFLFT